MEATIGFGPPHQSSLTTAQVMTMAMSLSALCCAALGAHNADTYTY